MKTSCCPLMGGLGVVSLTPSPPTSLLSADGRCQLSSRGILPPVCCPVSDANYPPAESSRQSAVLLLLNPPTCLLSSRGILPPVCCPVSDANYPPVSLLSSRGILLQVCCPPAEFFHQSAVLPRNHPSSLLSCGRCHLSFRGSLPSVCCPVSDASCPPAGYTSFPERATGTRHSPEDCACAVLPCPHSDK